MSDTKRQSSAVSKPVLASGLIVAGGLFVQLPLSAQTTDTAAPPTTSIAAEPVKQTLRPAQIDLAVEELLSLNALLVDRIEDPVWDLQAESGKQYLAIPVILPVSDEPLELDANLLRLRGGRFVAWRIPVDQADGGQSRVDDSAVPSYGSGDFAAGPDLGQGLRAIAPTEEATSFTLPPGVSLTLDQPRLTRQLTIEPQGMLRYQLDRFIPTAMVRESDNLYALKIKPDLLTKKEPLRPRFDPPPTGETAQSRAERIRNQSQTQQQYSQQLSIFNETRKVVFAAPQKLESPRPRLVWAIFEFSPAVVRELQFDGPPPLPWRIGLAQYDSLRALSAARIDNQGPSRDIGTQLYALVQMVAADSHPLNLRLAAKAMSGPKLLTLAKSGDDVYNVSRAILDGKDPAARAQIISDLVSISPATSATLDLLKVAARNADPGTQLLALRGLAQSGNTDPEVINLLTETANRLIVDANAPDPVTVLAEIFAATRAGSPENRANPESFYPFDLNTAPSSTNTPESTNINKLLAQQVQLKFTDPLRRDMVIAALLATSNTEPLAAHWINTQLLSGADPSLAQRTLELLANAKLVPLPETVGRNVKLQLPHYALTLDELFGQVPQTPSDSSTPKPKPYVTPLQQPFQIQLAEPFIITQGSHNYFKLLSSQSPAPVRELAWKALASISFPASESSPSNPSTGQQPSATPTTYVSPFVAFTDIAIAENSLYPMVLDFLTRQPNLPAASAALIRLTGKHQDKLSDQVMRQLLGSNRPLDQALTGMTIEDCLRFVRRMYDLHLPPTPTIGSIATPIAPAPQQPAPSPTPNPTLAATPPAPAPTSATVQPGAPAKPGSTAPATGLITPTATPALPPTRAPLVVGLLRDRQKVSTLAAWFMKEVALGRLPKPADWALAFGGEQALLQNVYSNDDELALASVAGLLATVQGPEELAKAWSDQVRGQPNRSPEFAAGLWTKLKQEVFVLRLKTAAGPYRLSMRIYPTEAAVIGSSVIGSPAPGSTPGFNTGYAPGYTPGSTPEFDPGFNPEEMGFDPSNAPRGDFASGSQGPALPAPPGKPALDEPLGILVLQADGKKVTFASQPINVTVPDTHIMLRLDKPTELKNLPNPKVAEIAWDRLTQPIELWPQADGSWLARFQLADSRIAELLMKPLPPGELPPPATQPVPAKPVAAVPATPAAASGKPSATPVPSASVTPTPGVKK